MRIPTFNLRPKRLSLRIRHPISPLHLRLKLLPTLHRIMMQSNPRPRNRSPPRIRLDHIPILAYGMRVR